MINKIIALSNIGRFEDYSAIGDVEFRKLNLIYGENGKGKSTLTAIYRSLKSNDPMVITERATLGSKNLLTAQIKLDIGQAVFNGTTWSIDNPNMEIFDSAFVNENVFSGETVEHDHKKNLYRFVVGEQGVSSTRKVEELDNKIKIVNSEMGKSELDITSKIIGRMDLKQFIALPELLKVDESIIQKEGELSSAKKSTEIVKKSALQKLSLPTFSDNFELLLSKSISTITTEAEGKTKEHIKFCMDARGEAWVQNGLNYIKDNSCPFCGQTLDDISLIEAYQGYFNEAYTGLKNEIKSWATNLDNLFSESALLHVQKFSTSNDSLTQFWADYISATYPSLNFDDIENAWKILRNKIQTVIKEKISAPLEKIILNEDFNLALKNYQKLNSEIKNYNSQVDEVNSLISKKKLEVGGSDTALIELELNRLKNSKIRFEVNTKDLCQIYLVAIQKKRDLEKEKREAKLSLDTFTEEVFKKYQDNINMYLAKFGAGFEIAETKTSYGGGRPSSTYRIKINDTTVDLGDTQTVGEACFRNVLSQGDKNSLAFAFFLARLDQDSDISTKIIIFDDPINSLDDTRKLQTRNEIVRMAALAKQVIIMSHDPRFLRSVWDYIDKNDVNALEITRGDKGSRITQWDIINDTETPYVRDYKILVNYVDKGQGARDLKDIARCIRPMLEGNLRMKFPTEFSDLKMLGECIALIKSSADKDNLNNIKNKLSELIDINDYSKQYHHDSNPGYNSALITDTELKAYVIRALDLIR